jgi:hypothetical protein
MRAGLVRLAAVPPTRARGFVNGHTRQPVVELEEAPLSFELIAERHEVAGLFRARGPTVNACGYP